MLNEARMLVVNNIRQICKGLANVRYNIVVLVLICISATCNILPENTVQFFTEKNLRNMRYEQ